MNVTNKEKKSKTQEQNAQWQNKRCREANWTVYISRKNIKLKSFLQMKNFLYMIF